MPFHVSLILQVFFLPYTTPFFPLPCVANLYSSSSFAQNASLMKSCQYFGTSFALLSHFGIFQNFIKLGKFSTYTISAIIWTKDKQQQQTTLREAFFKKKLHYTAKKDGAWLLPVSISTQVEAISMSSRKQCFSLKDFSISFLCCRAMSCMVGGRRKHYKHEREGKDLYWRKTF